MALAAPILLAMIFGMIQVGYAFMVQYLVENAAAKGGRAAVLPSRTQTAVATAINDVLQPMSLSGSATTTIKVNNVVSDVATAVSGDDVSVQVSIALADVILFPGFFNASGTTLTNTVTLRCQ